MNITKGFKYYTIYQNRISISTVTSESFIDPDDPDHPRVHTKSSTGREYNKRISFIEYSFRTASSVTGPFLTFDEAVSALHKSLEQDLDILEKKIVNKRKQIDNFIANPELFIK